jgi:hypothetical protein
MVKSRNTFIAVAAWMIVLLVNHPVYADPIRWSYDYQNIIGDPFGRHTVGLISAQQPAAGFLSSYPVNYFPPGPYTASGSSQIMVTSLTAFDFDRSPNPGPIPIAENYALNLYITDLTNGRVHNFFFLGNIVGAISPSGYSIANTFDAGPVDVPGLGPRRFPPVQSAFIGDNLYTVSINPIASNGLGGQVWTDDPMQPAPSAFIYAFVDVKPEPEPSFLALAGIGLGCFAVARPLRLFRK